ncbi:hypothetical protein HG531_002055 [Fusarium graminearum]|nr:hypothetical protein HG531_002055 [Fusarium graminearum]
MFPKDSSTVSGTSDEIVESFHLNIKVLDLLIDSTNSLGMDRLGSGLNGTTVVIGGCPVILELRLELVPRLLDFLQHFTFLEIPRRHTLAICINGLLKVGAGRSDSLLDLRGGGLHTRLLGFGLGVDESRYLSH